MRHTFGSRQQRAANEEHTTANCCGAPTWPLNPQPISSCALVLLLRATMLLDNTALCWNLRLSPVLGSPARPRIQVQEAESSIRSSFGPASASSDGRISKPRRQRGRVLATLQKGTSCGLEREGELGFGSSALQLTDLASHRRSDALPRLEVEGPQGSRGRFARFMPTSPKKVPTSQLPFCRARARLEDSRLSTPPARERALV